ncbi:hypothetical protein caldi_29880 [Caldinitratiruptor microaerophilus]|uniref:Uncharacterized protein n=1 Tax=Caldinitratiruptor microaerophilus TaxID=671077 RepID=A0AA35CNU7_9FIRM|nr:hypothetical protein caldi_29880 [Caldinitratiruptor microaerophilus]
MSDSKTTTTQAQREALKAAGWKMDYEYPGVFETWKHTKRPSTFRCYRGCILNFHGPLNEAKRVIAILEGGQSCVHP